ncbi:rho GTPase-activating protein 12-like isoform X1 [Acipenser ruthenus]|uniref:rho GTPase-activating protein 12-like isoform X1 n=1 Tax=Acipenser ruthenus TaxID=7906 RepID=UPI00145ADCEF|nr:rho GTPase-activating protein 12-like isoform X1 [Acipenser ruthenus]XP_058879231.1 rho GTPase-activating protein 12-like isoform X1 [Acipenser ruthenus]
MADKDGKADLPIIPGQVYVEVEYDYEYKAKDKMIVIKQGEHYILVKKTNEDWWQVKQDENTKPFYVPAQYVKELRKALMPPQKPLLSSPSGSLKGKSSALDIQPSHRSNENLAKTPELSSFGKHPPALPRDANQNLAPGSSPGLSRRVGEHHQNNNNTSRVGTDSPPPRIPNHNKATTLVREPVLDVDAEKTPPHEHPHGNLIGDGLEKHRNDSESGDDLSSSSTEHMQTTSPTGQGRAESPVYANLQELKISQSSLPPVPSSSPLHTIGEWDTHKDLNGRHYYFNRATQERTWKPPRARDTSSSSSSSTRGEPHVSGDQEPLSSEENCHSTYSSQSDSQYGSPPRGWSEELDEHGQTLYVSEYTNEKWIKHVDEQGRPYYYSADGSRSEWELPKVSKQAEEQKPYKLSPPVPGEFPKSRSLDRKQVDPIVLTKWRNSTYVLDLSDKLSVVHKRNASEHHTGVIAPPPYHEQESPTTPKQGFPDSDSCPSSPKHPTAASEKCGVLNVTKITEHGKKVRKNWTSSWAVLQGSTLLFAKGQGGGTGWSYYQRGSIPELLLSLLANWKHSVKRRPAVSYVNSGPVTAATKFGGSQSKPEFTVDLRGAILEWASKDKSSKKRVLELKTRQGTELLIQSENDTVINDWYKALGEMISTHAWESDEAIEEDMPESPGADKHDKDSRDSKKSRTMKSSVSIDSSDQKKTRVKLKKFLTRRPTLQAVRDKGYIKDQVFGCNLTSLCQREKTTVPSFVRMCIDHLENNGLNVDGLYRVSGNLAVIQKLRFAVNHDETLDLKDSKWEDTHVITGALKMFFRELPEPLFTHNYFNDFVSAIKSQDYEQRVQSINDLIKQLPKPNQDTMQALFKHLRKVIEHGEENRMNTQSVAIVFGPTLLRPETETGNIAVHMVYQNQIVELILLEYESIFGR